MYYHTNLTRILQIASLSMAAARWRGVAEFLPRLWTSHPPRWRRVFGKQSESVKSTVVITGFKKTFLILQSFYFLETFLRKLVLKLRFSASAYSLSAKTLLAVIHHHVPCWLNVKDKQSRQNHHLECNAQINRSLPNKNKNGVCSLQVQLGHRKKCKIGTREIRTLSLCK